MKKEVETGAKSHGTPRASDDVRLFIVSAGLLKECTKEFEIPPTSARHIHLTNILRAF